MDLFLLYAISVIAAFVGWYACGPVESVAARGILRASVIAALCAPGVVIGHGFAVVPTAFALAVQPSVFTLASIGVVWLIMLGVVFAVPTLRRHANGWPPSARELFIDGYPLKFVLFGIVYAMFVGAAVYADDTFVIRTLKFALFFGGATASLVLCYQASKLASAHWILTPALFSVPVFFVAAAPATLLWFGAGAAGALAGRGRGHVAACVASAACALLAMNFLERSYQAIDAPAHVTIEGGVAGNAAFAALFIGLAIASWWLLRRCRVMADAP